MDRRRKIQAALLIVINLGFFLALDLFSPTPIIFDNSENIPNFRVINKRLGRTRWEFFLIYSSETEYSSFNPIQEKIEERNYGEFIKYEVEFLEEIYDAAHFSETIQAATSMDVRMIICTRIDANITEVTDYLEEEGTILFTPYSSIDRNLVTTDNVLSLLPNTSEKAKLYSELLNMEQLDLLIIYSNSSLGASIPNFYNQSESIILHKQCEIEETIKQPETKVGIFTEKTTNLAGLQNETLRNVTIYCETIDTGIISTVKQFKPIPSNPERYNDFTRLFTNLTGLTPEYTDALLYDTCRILAYNVENSRYRPWDRPESIWETAKTIEGATGNCTLTPEGDRMYQKYVLETMDN